MKLAKIKVNDFGGAPFAEHNMPCPVCRVEKAVIQLNDGVFAPCWKCQAKGWLTIQAKPWQLWLLRRIFGKHHYYLLRTGKGN